MTPQQLDAILQAVEAKYFPDHLDRDELIADLHDADLEYRMGVWARHGRAAERKYLEQILATARKLRSLLGPPPHMPLRGGQSNHNKAIGDLIDDVQWVLDGPRFQGGVVENIKEQQEGDNLGALEWLAGIKLPEIFERHFGIEAKTDRNPDRSADRPAEGPYIDFAEQALIALGITNRGKAYSREYIARALTEAKPFRPRSLVRKFAPK